MATIVKTPSGTWKAVIGKKAGQRCGGTCVVRALCPCRQDLNLEPTNFGTLLAIRSDSSVRL